MSSFIDPNARIGKNNIIGPFCYIGPNVEIGDNNVLISHVSIGHKAQHRSNNNQGSIKIGNNNTFREFVTIHNSTGDRPTTIGNNCYLMSASHVPHDCLMEDDVTMANCATLGGHSFVMVGATIGLNACVHQHLRIGAYSMIGQGSAVVKHIPPFTKAFGNPARLRGLNEIGIVRAGIDLELIKKSIITLTGNELDLDLNQLGERERAIMKRYLF
jgi:UDP-N-acetylglucosamine acyltransferase